jgi:hypothetical protein
LSEHVPVTGLDPVLSMRRRELAEALGAGHPIDPRALDDAQYRGVSLGLPGWLERLTWKKFRKTFHRDPESGALRGWNVRLVQNGLDAPDEPMTRGDRAMTFGHYEVVDPGGAVPNGVRGLLIDYGRGGNGALDPAGRMRDPLVALEPGSVDRLLGWSYLDLGFATIGTPSYFLLVRDGPLVDVVPRPG